MKSSLLTRLAAQPDALNHLLANLTEDQLRQRPQPATWSIFENLAHLGRYQAVFIDRIERLISAEAMPSFRRYVADDDVEFARWTQLSLARLVERMRSERTVLNAFLGNLSEEQLMRVGMHPAFGPMTVEGWTEFFLLHEAHHLFTILRLGGALRALEQPMGL